MGCSGSVPKDTDIVVEPGESCEVLTRFDESKQKQVIISNLLDAQVIKDDHNTIIVRKLDCQMLTPLGDVNFEEKLLIIEPQEQNSIDIKEFFSTLSQIPLKNLFGIKIHLGAQYVKSSTDNDLQEITKFIKAISQTSDQLRFVSFKIPGWNQLSNKGLGRFLVGLKSLLQKNKRVKFFELDFENADKVEDIIVENIANCIHQLADNNKCILHFSLNLNYWIKCTNEAVQYLVNSIIKLGGANTSLKYFYLNLSSWGLCTKKGLTEIGQSLYHIADSNQHLKYFGLEMEDWWQCKQPESQALVQGFLKLSQSNSQIKQILLNFSNWGLGSQEPFQKLEENLKKILPKVEKQIFF
ncbi:hypothetical protein TTHERM_00102820 (macronuclear) [Tetrahymena thermophila SB210]|uniref:Uncharacterized protein n=1 Tax=Tetrahymena thermophila (strain SB210) TaxID=312017 RepID=Q234L6_TETTS|nr:hypothetical protein TTHERM_00102820 [Tetrahymena thermophila SB210]EAR91987.2 hypothetical protein TTHERM_00102820 [Tetrahymena thermophila SB210]|eukprot:XP_001012232.2 hypothetical protein TTHERM_00102820 [Tetrahymena thermophila SB210]